jgi:DNA-directed RNA polymerase specialized sigma24 family protein
MTAAGLTRLLNRLDPDADRAAHQYEDLRQALLRFFDWRGGSPPDECADDVIDRLARRLEEDTDVQDVRHYALGIARLVLLERQRAPAFSPLDDVRDGSIDALTSASPEEERLQHCFDRCLAALPEEARSLVLAYYEEERGAKIANRRRLASAYALTENALRSRVQRLRDRLASCVTECTNEKRDG